MKPEPTCLLGHCAVLVCTDISLSTVHLGSRPQRSCPSSVDRFLENGLKRACLSQQGKAAQSFDQMSDTAYGQELGCRQGPQFGGTGVPLGPKPRFGYPNQRTSPDQPDWFLSCHERTQKMDSIRPPRHYGSTWLRWSFRQPGLAQSLLESREVFGQPIRAHHVLEGGNT